MHRSSAFPAIPALATLLLNPLCLSAHEQTEPAHEAKRRAEQAVSEDRGYRAANKTCRLTIHLLDSATGLPLPGSIRIRQIPYGAQVPLEHLVRRYDWYSITESVTVAVPARVLRVEAFYGLGTELIKKVIDLNGRREAEVRLSLKRFYDPAAGGLRAANTHLHLKGLTREQADRYLDVVPRADSLDLVYVSHLRRLNAEHTYITNAYTDEDLRKLSRDGVLFDNGIEHRNNFKGTFGHGYGHVLLLHLNELIRPMSIGPDIMDSGTDAPALRPGIQRARRQGGSAIWCHNAQGTEDIPSWLAGLLDAQNIFDGGNTGSYEDTYYRYLNIGLKTPFSAGSDWFIEDFARVYVPIDGPLKSADWLAQLGAGRSYITNGPFLEFRAGNQGLGDTIRREAPGEVAVVGRALGRKAFQRIELVYNGEVVASAPSRAVEGHFEATINLRLRLDKPGWLALRLAPDEVGDNEFDHTLFAHSSPIYIEIGGRRIFRPDVAEGLVEEMRQSMRTIREKARFDDDDAREQVLQIYRDAIKALNDRR